MEQTTLDYYHSSLCTYEFQETETVRKIFACFNGLSGRLLKEGDEWCAITGELPEPNCIVGFAKRPDSALRKWYEFYITGKS